MAKLRDSSCAAEFGAKPALHVLESVKPGGLIADHVGKVDGGHGLLNPKGPEGGDLPNIWAGADGAAGYEAFSMIVPSDAFADEDGVAARARRVAAFARRTLPAGHHCTGLDS